MKKKSVAMFFAISVLSLVFMMSIYASDIEVQIDEKTQDLQNIINELFIQRYGEFGLTLLQNNNRSIAISESIYDLFPRNRATGQIMFPCFYGIMTY